MRMRAPVLVAMVLAFDVPALGSAEDARSSSNFVSGDLSLWNGSPHPVGIVATDGVIYGVPEPENDQQLVPEELLTLLQKATAPISGGFTLCPLGRTAAVPYDERPIVLVSILDFDIESK